MRGPFLLAIVAVSRIAVAQEADKPPPAPAPAGDKAPADKPADKPATDKAADKQVDKPAADKPADKKPSKPAPDKPVLVPVSPTTQALLDRVAKRDKAAIDELYKIAPTIVGELGTFLQRPHTSPAAERRLVLESFRAQVPDEKGRFTPPKRLSAKEEKALDNLDWLAELQKLTPSTPLAAGSGSAAAPSDAGVAVVTDAALGELIADVAALRALSASKDMKATSIMFEAAFAPETMIYRDEVGRYIRKMEPYCIPALMRESQSRNFDRKRYSNYQLERLDRQEPGKALAAATTDENVTIAILEVWRATKHREAVQTVWTRVNADSARIRAKAREAWRAYIEGPAPPPAPMKKLMLPGGKLTKKEKPLWLTYRELADNELRKQSNELLGTDYKIVDPTLDDSDAELKKPKVIPKIDIKGVTKELFDYYDRQRAEQEAKQWAEADAKAKAGDIAGAVAVLDRLLVANPDHGSRAQMANVYFAHAKELEAKNKWSEAAAAYSKAHGLAPTGSNAKQALAAHHYTLGKWLETQGKDGGPDFRKATALVPDYAPAKEAAVQAAVRDSGGRPTWMLYLAAFAMLAALGLFAAGMMLRRRTSP